MKRAIYSRLYDISLTVLLLFLFSGSSYSWAQSPTYAERLGWPEGTKVIIFHVDDAGMSHDSNQGAIQALEKGVATSCSIMMPCPWVPEMAAYLGANLDVDAGVHLTLTAEWKNYRWGPVAGKPAVPGLVDDQGCLHRSGPARKAELQLMTDPDIKKFIENEDIVLTTWRELKKRRDNLE